MWRFWIAAFVGIAASADDIARRRISNWIPAAAFLAGLVLQLWESGWRGGLSSLAGSLAGGCAFLIFYLMGGMGGGDIKLMAGFGAMLGATGVIEAALWTGASGGLMAICFLTAAKTRFWWTRRKGAALNAKAEPHSIPYAPAITAGVWLTLLAK